MAEFTKTAAASPQPLPQFAWMLLLALVVFVYFFGLTIPLLGPDEPRYAQVAREMWQAGDWITPTLGGFHWFEKPALLYWLQIASYSIFGTVEFAARFGSALFGLGTIAAMWLLGRKSTSACKSGPDVTYNRNSQFANYLALITATSLGVIVFSHGASFDIIVTFPLTASLVSFFIFDPSSKTDTGPKYFPLVLFYFFIGVSLLAKGLIGILFPYAIVAGYFILSRRLPTRALVVSLVWGTLLACSIAAIWYLPMYQRHGWEFIDEFFIQHHFQRFSSNKYQHPQPFYFFLWVLPLMTFPWIPFFFAAIWKAAKTLAGIFQPARRSEVSPLVAFAFSWLAVPLLFFSLSGSKLPGYILPAVPAAIILTALAVFELAERSSKWRTAIITAAAAMLVGVVGLFIFAVPRFAETDTVRSLIKTADSRGFGESRVLMVYTISHNAEFYAPGRLFRDHAGKQKRFNTVDDLLAVLASEKDCTALALVPVEHLAVLTRDARIKTEVLGDNTELAIAAISAK